MRAGSLRGGWWFVPLGALLLLGSLGACDTTERGVEIVLASDVDEDGIVDVTVRWIEGTVADVDVALTANGREVARARASAREHRFERVDLRRWLDEGVPVMLRARVAGASAPSPVTPLVVDAQTGAMRRLIDDVEGPTGRASGRVITVMTASGGAGGTTLAINLADELRTSTGGAALLVDLDLDYGAMAAYLGLNPEYGVADVLKSHGSIDAQLIRSTASVHLDDLQVLTSPASVEHSDPGGVGFEKLEAMLGVCREAFPITVIDAPRTPRDVAARLAVASDLTLVVFQLSVIDVRSARARMRAMTDRGAPPERILPVANRWVKRSKMLSLDDARDAFAGIEVAKVGNDFESVIRSINYGQPIAQVAGRSVVRKDIRKLAERIQSLEQAREGGE